MPKEMPLCQRVDCQEMRLKKEPIRVVKNPEGETSLGFKGEKPDHEVYVCPNMECLRWVRKFRALEWTFSAAMPDGVYNVLEAQMREDGDG